jgi:hypothetical protein
MVVTEYRTPSAVPNGTPQPARLNRSSATGRLEQDERQDDRVGAEFDPAGLQRCKKKRAERDAGQESDENRKNSSPYGRNGAEIEDQNIKIDGDLDDDDRRIENAIGVKEERNRYGERRKPVAECAIDKGGKENDPGEHEHSAIEGGHLSQPNNVKPTAERASIGESTSTKSRSKRTAHSLFGFAKKFFRYQSGKNEIYFSSPSTMQSDQLRDRAIVDDAWRIRKTDCG